MFKVGIMDDLIIIKVFKHVSVAAFLPLCRWRSEMRAFGSIVNILNTYSGFYMGFLWYGNAVFYDVTFFMKVEHINCEAK